MKEKKMGKRQEKRENAKREKIATFFFSNSPSIYFPFSLFFYFNLVFLFSISSLDFFLTMVCVAFEPTKSTESY
jgi:hypothetical protein